MLLPEIRSSWKLIWQSSKTGLAAYGGMEKYRRAVCFEGGIGDEGKDKGDCQR